MNAFRVSLFVGVCLAGCGPKAAQDGVRQESDAPAHVTTAAAVARPTPDTLDVNGTLAADQQSDLTSIVPGRVTQVYVERGAKVNEGDPIVRLRDVDFRLQAAAANAAVEQARARLGLAPGQNESGFDPGHTSEAQAAAVNRDLAADTLTRTERLAQQGAVSQAELDRARAGAQGAQQQYDSVVNGARGALVALRAARVQLAQAGQNVRESTLRAPFAGEIAERYVDVGEFVSPASRIVSLVKTDPLRLEVQVPQRNIGSIRVGQTVAIRVDAFPEETFAGTVRYISAAVRTDTRGLGVDALVPNADGRLRPGLFASARIDLGRQRNVVELPAAAVLDEAGAHRAFVIVGHRVSERVLTIVDRDERHVLVSDGVRAGENVATEGIERLVDDQTVR